MNSKVVVGVCLIGMLLIPAIAIKSVKDLKAENIQTLKIENCKVVEVIESKGLFDPQKYRYKCASGTYYKTQLKVNF